MHISNFTADSLPPPGDSRIIVAASLSLSLSQPPEMFYRHGWQSWSLATWLDPRNPPRLVRAAEFRMKDEDPVYALARNHVSAWVGAVEFEQDDILLLGALDLGGRVELDGKTLNAWYETLAGEWFLARGKEDEVFTRYAEQLGIRFGTTRFTQAPRVWCSWYSLYRWVNERVLLKALRDFGDMPFDVFQVDDGWQLCHGDWEANRKFPSGMETMARKISDSGRTPGIWIAPFMVAPNSRLGRNHPEWLLRDEKGNLVRAGITWSGNPLCLDVSHPEVLAWIEQLIRKARGWGYGYLKLDFLYIGALPGKRHHDVHREAAYRSAMRVIREAAGDAYILACGAPVIPTIGLCDGIRVGPDVAPFWLNKPLTVWLDNPNDTSTQNAIRTSVHRLWLHPLVNVDPDVAYFRSRNNALEPHEKQMLQDLGTISGFKATSDLPQWLAPSEKELLRDFLQAAPGIQKVKRYQYDIDRRLVDFSRVIPLPASSVNIPVWLAKHLGLLEIVRRQALPAIWESRTS